jgi:hypothetical protein
LKINPHLKIYEIQVLLSIKNLALIIVSKTIQFLDERKDSLRAYPKVGGSKVIPYCLNLDYAD